MSRLIILLIVISCSATQKSNKIVTQERSESRITLDSIIAVAKQHSLYKHDVKWDAVESIMTSKLKGDSISAIIEPVEYMFSELKDFHGALYVNGNRYNSYYKTDHHYPVDRDLYNSINNMKSEVNGKLLDGQIAYVKIPHFYTANQDQISTYTSDVRNVICDLKRHKPIGWIIDLRVNIGGNMYPMLSGLGELFPNLILGGDSTDGETYHSNWHIEKGDLHMWDTPMTNTTIQCNPNERNINEDTKVIFLIGRYTASSGEAVASAFKSQKNTRLIGEITSGWSSTTGWFQINDNVLFSPTVAYFMSKDSTLHTDGVVPDEIIVEELKIDSLLTNLTLQRAIEWVNEK